MMLPAFLFFISIIQINSQWIDPYSMDSMNFFSKPTTNTNTDKEVSVCSKKCPQPTNCESDMYLRRIVRLIITNAYLDRDEGADELQGHLNMKLSLRDYQFLVGFSKSHDSVDKDQALSEVSSIFETSLEKSFADRLNLKIFTLEEQLFNLVYNRMTGGIAATCVVLYVIYKLVKAQFTWRSILIYLLCLLYAADFAITYLQILEEEEIDNLVTIKKMGTIPPECDPSKLSWFGYLKLNIASNFYKNPCKEYYEAAMRQYKFVVAPRKVLSMQLKTLIFEPFGELGEAFGKFGRGMFTSLPWGLNVVLFPIMLLVSVVMIFMFFLFLMKPQFKLSLFHLFTIELGYRDRGRNDRPRAVQVGYQGAHRAFIEEASHNSSGNNRVAEGEKRHSVEEKKSDKELFEDQSVKKSEVDNNTVTNILQGSQTEATSSNNEASNQTTK